MNRRSIRTGAVVLGVIGAATLYPYAFVVYGLSSVRFERPTKYFHNPEPDHPIGPGWLPIYRDQYVPLIPRWESGYLSRLTIPVTNCILLAVWITFALTPKLLIWGKCHACGYDTRANRQRCSECGAEQ